MLRPRLLLVNGPPRSGKDTVGRLIAQSRLNVRVDKFARILKDRCHAAYGFDPRKVPHDYFENRKDQQIEEFLGVTPRQAYIAFSEQFLKPLHGKGVFAHLLLNEMAFLANTLLVITDSGFREEAEIMVSALGADRTRLLRLARPGTSFEGDSRSYIDLSDLGVNAIRVENPGDSEEKLLSALQQAIPEVFP